MDRIIELLVTRTPACEALVQDCGNASAPEWEHDGIIVDYGEDGLPLTLLFDVVFLAEDVFDLSEQAVLGVGWFKVGQGLEVAVCDVKLHRCEGWI